MTAITHPEQDVDLDELSRAWLHWWDAVVPATGPITAAVPWRTLGIGLPAMYGNPGHALRGPLATCWMGFDPERGIVHAVRTWDPSEDSKPPVPEGRWRLSTPDISLGKGMDAIWERNGVSGFRYPTLPLPIRFAGAKPDLTKFIQARSLPFHHFVELTGLPQKSLALATIEPGDADERMGFGRKLWPPSSSTIRGLLWIAGNSPAADVLPATARSRRIQALAVASPFASMIRRDGVSDTVVDPALPLVPDLAERLGVQPSTIQILSADATRRMAEDPLYVPAQFVDRRRILLDMLDAMSRPRLQDLVESMNLNRLDNLKEMASALAVSSHTSVARRIGHRMRSDAAGGWDWLRGDPDRWVHLRDIAEEFGRDVLWPCCPDPDLLKPSMAFDRQVSLRHVGLIALCSLPPLRLAAIVDEHMRGALRRAAAVASRSQWDFSVEAYWLPLAAPTTAPSGQMLRFLTTASELAREGLQLQHCVGDYVPDCLRRSSAIMSIGNWITPRDWQASSTVELGRGRGDQLQVQQHFGLGNSNPMAEDAASLQWWMAEAGAGRIAIDNDVLTPISGLASVQQLHGADWDTPEAHAARWDRWRRILGVRQSTAAAFLQHALSTVLREDDTSFVATDSRKWLDLVLTRAATLRAESSQEGEAADARSSATP